MLRPDTLAHILTKNAAAAAVASPGRAVQFDPIKPTVKAPGSERLKLKYEELLSNFGFKFKLRHYSPGPRRRWTTAWRASG